MSRAGFHRHRSDQPAIDLQKLLLIGRIVRDGLRDISAAAVRDLQWRPTIFIHPGKNYAPVVDQRIDVKNFAGNEARQHMIGRSFAQCFALIQFIDSGPNLFAAVQFPNADRRDIRTRL